MNITEYTRSINDANQQMFKAKYGLKEFHSDNKSRVKLWLQQMESQEQEESNLDSMIAFTDSIGGLSKD